MKRITIFVMAMILFAGYSQIMKTNRFANLNYSISSLFAEEIEDTTASVVYFTKEISGEGVLEIYDKIGSDVEGRIAFKTHFGEPGNQNYLKPELSKPLVQKLGATYVETNVLYGGPRGNTEGHIGVAKKHGFGFAPIDILESEGDKRISVDGLKHFDAIVVGNDMENYDWFVIFSHFKGHGLAGFGGAIKNISMGLAPPRGKRAMHASSVPKTRPEKCTKCKICYNQCPANAIELGEIIVLDKYKCIGCGKCASVCQFDAIFMEKHDAEVFMEKLVEYVKGIDDNYNMVYINVLANISKTCDCASNAPPPFVGDIGIVAGTDIVAVEKASLDLVNKATGHDDTFEHVNHLSGNRQIEYAEKLGLGTSNYRLINID
jgi:uncharacterized Fe-S center protein